MSNSSRRISDRVLAVILSVLLMVGMLPTSVFAAVPGTHEGVFTFTVTDGENPIDGAEVTYTVTTAADGEAPANSAEEKASTGTDGVAKITTNLPETLESDVTVTVNYTVKASGYTDVTSTHTVASLSDNVAVTMTAIPTVDVTATVVGKGAITVGGTTVDAENIAKVAEGTVNTIVVTPATGYEISSLSISGIAVVINEINKGGYTDTTYQFDAATEIEVTFVDIQAPVISLVEAAPNGWTNTDKTVTVTASDNSGSFTVYYYYTADGESAAQEAENGSFTAERLGNYTVYAVDIANNKCAEQTIDVTQVDKDAPVVDSISGNPSSWETAATIHGDVSDVAGGSGVSKVVFGTSIVFENATDAGVTFDAVGGTYSFAVNANGTYYVWAIDASGNHSEAKSIEITKIDNTYPTISVTANPDNWTNGIIKVEIEAGDAQSNVTVKYSDVAVGDAGAADATQEDDKWTFNIDKDIDGTYTYYVWALDEVGHQESAEVTVYYDGTPPIVAITPLTSTDWTNQDVTITGTVDGVTESTTVSGLDKVVYGTDNDPQNATGVATVEGLNYSFTVTTNGIYNVWSLDKAGNYSDVATIEINNIDKTAPTVDSINVQQGFWPWERNDVTVSGTVSDLGGSNVVKVVYSDSNTFVSNLPAATLNSDGTYSFVISKRDFEGYYYVWAIDAAGNVTVQPKQAELNMDITPPTIQRVTANPNVWTNTNVIVTISASDNREISKVVYSTSSTYADTHTAATDNMDGTYSFPVPNTNDFNGKYYIWAVDQAGNESTAAEVQIQIDVTKPTTSDPVADPSTWTNTDVTITGTATDTGGSGISKVVYSTENRYNADLPEATLDRDNGKYSIVVSNESEFNGNYYIWVVDGAGNESEAKSVSVQIDTTKPTAEIKINTKSWATLLNALTFGLFSKTQLDVTITANDAGSPIANSGVAKIEYYKVINDAAENLLSRDALKDLEWTTGDSLSVSSDEVFVVYAKVTDNAGNIEYFCSDGAIVDTKDAVIELTPSAPAADNGDANVYGYYNDDVTVNVKVTDAAPYSGIKSVEYWVTADGTETQRETLFNFTNADPMFNDLVSSWENDIVIDAEKNNSCNVILTVKVIDNAGNDIEKSISLDIDKTAPTISVSYNTNAAANEKYFGVVRTATIVITERPHHFDETAATNGITITAKDGNDEEITLDLSTMISAWVKTDGATPDETTYTAKITYSADANYEFAIDYTDKANNKNTPVNTGTSVAPYEFTIAKAVPTGSVSILTNTWDTLLDALTFGLFSNDKYEVVTTASDNTSPIKIEYYKVTNDKATTPLTWAQLDAVTDWTLLVDNGQNEVEDMNVLTVDKNEQFVVYLKLSNYAGVYTYISTDGAIVDKTQAAIEFTPSAPAADNGDPSVYGYYNDDVTVGIKVTDAAPYSGIKSVEYWVTAGGVETQRETLFTYNKANPTQAELVNTWTDDIVVEAVNNNSCNVIVYVKVIDNAGNENTKSVALDIDVTDPRINVSYDDNAPVNGKYFDGTRTATIVITERSHHFDPAAATNGITITAKDADGKAVTIDPATMISSWTENIGSTADATTYTATITYSVDANYTFAIEYTDKATNKNTTVDTGSSAVPYEFTVDATKPTGSASIGTNVWDKLLETLTFGLYSNEKFDVAASANDVTSPLKIEYYKVSGEKAPTVLKATDLDAITTWSLLVNNGENTIKDLHTLTVSDDEQFVVYFKITDYAGNYIYVCTDGAIVEDTPAVVDEPAPEITIEPEQPINGLYNGDVKVDIKVTDPLYGETYSGLKSVSYKVFNMGEVTQEGVLYSFTETAPTSDKLLQTWTGSITVDSKLNNSNDVKIEVYAQDNALNASSNSANIKIDITAPKIDFRYDNDNLDSGTYYNANRTATIVVTERNFKSEDVIVTITNTDGTIPTISSWTSKEGTGNGDDTTYTATITYAADGDYTFAIEYTDLANNKCTEINSTSTNPYAFTIDKTAPTISVAYNNNAVANEKYFNAVRTATVTIVEHNFNVDRVIFTRNTARGGQLPNITWTNNGDTHVATISYTADGDYTFDVTMTDMAGNASGAANYGNSAAGKDFVIDTTFEDMISISGVENGVAYGHDADVIPNIKISDINLNGYTVALVGVQKDKTIDLTEEVNKLLDAGSETVTGIFDIFETKQDLDGIYTLTLTSEDKAGNKDSEEIVFTVNRFGSVYVYSQYLLDLIADGGSYVISVDEDLVIDEYNADRLLADSLKIEITVDGRPLENVKYTVTPEINDTVAVGESGWFQYKYTISKDNFADDGVYKISISSKDATGNKPENNNYEGMEMNFRVDSTKPEITSIVGLEESIINAQEVTVKYTVFDTIGLKSIKVYVNGELVDEITDFSADMNNFSGQFTLLEQSNAQSVKIIAEDMSGNITDTSSEDFTSAYAFNDSVTVSTNAFVRWYANKPLFWGSIAGTAAIGGGIWYLIADFLKKRALTKVVK